MLPCDERLPNAIGLFVSPIDFKRRSSTCPEMTLRHWGDMPISGLPASTYFARRRADLDARQHTDRAPGIPCPGALFHWRSRFNAPVFQCRGHRVFQNFPWRRAELGQVMRPRPTPSPYSAVQVPDERQLLQQAHVGPRHCLPWRLPPAHAGKNKVRPYRLTSQPPLERLLHSMMVNKHP